MTFSLPQKTHTLWLLRIFVAIALVCLAVVKFCRLSSKDLLPTAILAVIGSVILFVYIYFYLKSYEITFDRSGVVITKGVIIKTTVIIPCFRLAFVKSYATPIMSLLDLKVIVLKVTRGWIFIPEIENEQAECMLKMMRDDKKDI